MTKLIGILFLAAAACTSTTAQEAKPPDAPLPAAAHTNDGVPTATVFKIAFETEGLNVKPQRDRRLEFPPPGFVISHPQWVVKDGALYLDFGSGTLFPVPGGGASGCFDQNLPERIKKVRSRIEAFPPFQWPAIPRR